MKFVEWYVEVWKEPLPPSEDDPTPTQFTPYWHLFMSYKGQHSEIHARTELAKFTGPTKARIVKVETTYTEIATTQTNETATPNH